MNKNKMSEEDILLHESSEYIIRRMNEVHEKRYEQHDKLLSEAPENGYKKEYYVDISLHEDSDIEDMLDILMDATMIYGFEYIEDLAHHLELLPQLRRRLFKYELEKKKIN